MNDRRDLNLILHSNVPLIVVETTDESRFIELLKDVTEHQPRQAYRPLFRWSVTDGMQRVDLALEQQSGFREPGEVLTQIRESKNSAIYALLDFHPYLADPYNVRMLKDIAIDAQTNKSTVVLISHAVEIPAELRGQCASFELSLPDADERRSIVNAVLEAYRDEHSTRGGRVDPHAFELLVENLSGLTHADAERLARNAVFDDGAITADDVPAVMQTKYELLNRDSILSYEYDTVDLSSVAGFSNVKVWLQQRKSAFESVSESANRHSLDAPKGILLLGVQGCGKSLAAKAAAAVFGVPLLRLEFGALFNKFHGETERNLRESLQMAERMSPCVLWLDEIEKGLASGSDESGTSKRVLASLLTWMAERQSKVMLVATANDIEALPPELIRKGRFDEIFFVDLPEPNIRAQILEIHLRDRGLDPSKMDLPRLTHHTNGFSGAELEQGIVAALYAAHALKTTPSASHVLAEYRKTKPLSVVMDGRIDALREWAKNRTVPADGRPELSCINS